MGGGGRWDRRGERGGEQIGFMAFAPLSSSPTTAPWRCLMVSSVLPATRQPRTIRRLSRETKADANKREKARRRVCQ